MTEPQPVIVVVSVDCEFDGPSTANGALQSWLAMRRWAASTSAGGA